MSLVKDYLQLYKQYSEEYGPNTIILMQVGAFYEVYGLRKEDGSIYQSNIEAFASLCDLIIARKKSCVGSDDVVMAGFRDYMLDKYLNKLQESGYTAVVYSQDAPSKNTTRSLTGIYSPGTFFSANTTVLSNVTLCLRMIKSRTAIHVGLAMIDIFTGKTAAFELSTSDYHNPTSFDQLERYVSVYDPSEILFIHDFDEKYVDDIISFIGAENRNNIRIKISDKSNRLAKMAINCEKQTVQNEILIKFNLGVEQEYQTHSLFGDHELSAFAFCFLLDYVHSHNPDLTNRLQEPVLENQTDRLLLANHSLQQLNIIDDHQYTGKCSSVSSLLNSCVTPMGRRAFKYKMLNPISNPKELNKSYDLIDQFRQLDELQSVRSLLKGVRDLEKLERKRLLKRTTPFDFAQLIENLKSCSSISKMINIEKEVDSSIEDICCQTSEKIEEKCGRIINHIEDVLDVNKCKHLDTLRFSKSASNIEESDAESDETDLLSVAFIKRGKSDRIDQRVRSNIEGRDKLECIRKAFDDLVTKGEKKTAGKNDYVKIHETPTMGVSIITTKRRSVILLDQLKKLKNKEMLENTFLSRFDNNTYSLEINISDLNIISTTSTNVAIWSPQIRELATGIRLSKEALVDEIYTFFMYFSKEFEQFAGDLLDISRYITTVDVWSCLAHTSIKNAYCKPVIDETETDSYMDVRGIRHPLIEKLQTKETYVSNDVILGCHSKGALLYGTNAVGKTSLIRSLGIACILAQSGMYVPATALKIKPYKSIFTRILGNDNLFKGMSTFAVEMSELRSILKMADNNSLILGDELCSGTESDSALSIFMAGIEHLSQCKSSYLFATHFHEMVNMEEFKKMKDIEVFHMSVRYDSKSKMLMYDRKLQKGPGESMYGLEVCKSLQLPDVFLRRAHEIRMKYRPDSKNVTDMKKSRYNRKKLMGNCEICKKTVATDVHHLRYQKDADASGHIDGMHKNHVGNLASVCKECHDMTHAENIIWRRVKTSNGYQLIKEDQ